jgi:SecD/SecF fusion protein
MYRDLWWKALLIAFLIFVSVLYVYPPSEKLKAGLDLAGGTSLIYEIDSSDLDPAERRGLAERMIPILLKRIDPTHVANIIMRPQGDTRIEIQLPVASLDTINKRKAYQDLMDKLQAENINLMQVKRALSLDASQRQTILADFCKDSPERKAIVDQLTETYDLRTAKQKMRDELSVTLDKFKQQLTTLGLKTEGLAPAAAAWSKLPKDQQKKQIEDFVKERLANAQSKSEMIVPVAEEYLLAYSQWAVVMNEITDPEKGLNARWNKAIGELANINLNTDTLRQILDMPSKSTKRTDMLKVIDEKYPSRKEQIKAVVSAYDIYARVGGKLDDPEDLKRMLKGSGVLEFRILPGADLANAAAYKENLAAKGPKGASDSRYIWCEAENAESIEGQGRITGQFGDKLYVLASNLDGEKMTRSAKAWKMKKAYPTQDQEGRRAIGFTFDEVAANLFFSLTNANIEKPLCILLDNMAISAPNINSAISSSGIITGGRGGFTETQVNDMVNKLNAGSFPARLSDVPISEKTIGPAIGSDNREQGIRSAKAALIAVSVFMIAYYLLGGAIADIALVLNVLFLLATMSILRATFTMGGIAGMVLTIGMSVDANVLIFERIREEQKRGSSLRAAIANGYGRAFRTIFDSNMTTFFTALILYLVASEEIKGFALVLMIGIAWSMFTALTGTRLIFDFLTRKNLITGQLKMLGFFGNININWMKLRPVFLTFSGIMIIGGIIVFFTRDETNNSKYDIEFTGGTSVQIDLKAGTGFDRNAVEKKFQDYAKSKNNSALMVAKVYSIGQTGLQYEITTTETNLTVASVQFNQPGQTVAGLTEKIHKAEDNNNFILSRLTVTSKDAKTFDVSTSRVSASMVERVLLEAVGKDGEVSKPVVNEVVADAIQKAFGEYLVVQKNLAPVIVSVEKINDVSGELAEYLGGIKIVCKLGQETTAGDLASRIRDLKSKPDMQDIKWYKQAILSESLAEMKDSDKVSQFVFVSLHPEAGYRELSESEWNSYIENEKTKLIMAGSIESTLSRMTQIDPSVGDEAKTRAILAIVLSLLGIVAYVWFRFGTAGYGVAAIVALIHDVLITLGVVVGCTYIAGSVLGKALLIEDFKINLDIIAAFLTLIGYSINDTIVVFDRIRENRGKNVHPTPQIINDSINQTLSRTILTSFLTWLAVFVMYVWGGSGFRGFNFVMLFGIIIGTYSSIAIAAPILLIGGNKKDETNQ